MLNSNRSTFFQAGLYGWMMFLAILICATVAPVQAASATSSLLGEENDSFVGSEEVLHFAFEQDPSRPYDGDKDLDNMPDDWNRRKGDNFPQYVNCGIDRSVGQKPADAEPGSSFPQSFRVDLNGGDFACYSPFNKAAQINPLYSYVFEGWIRTEGLKNSAAMISINLVNSKRESVQRYLSEPVTGTWNEWQKIEIRDILPQNEVSYVFIGLHVVNQRAKDIRGTVWFDTLRLAKKPRLSSSNDFYSHFKDFLRRETQDTNVKFKISGLNYDHKNTLHLTLKDSADGNQQHKVFQIERPQDPNIEVEKNVDEIIWELNSRNLEIGFYEIAAVLKRDDYPIAQQTTSFAIMDLVQHKDPDFELKGEFGWSIHTELPSNVLDDLGRISGQAGINWMKYPVWKQSFESDQQPVAELFKDISSLGITAVGVLQSPPPDLREQFKLDWSGVREVFNMSRKSWSRALEPAIAHFASTVQYWQLGGDEDLSFVGEKGLGETITSVKNHFDIVGRNTKVGVRWTWDADLPQNVVPSSAFLTIKNEPVEQDEDSSVSLKKTIPADKLLYSRLVEARKSDNKIPLWVLIKPLDGSYEKDIRGSDLVKRMVAAKRGGANQIYAMNIFSPEYGLMMTSGSPTLLFLPWRTTALALRNSKSIGSFRLTNESTNYLFEKENEVVMVLWNEKEQVEEQLFLGNPEQVKIYNVWGQQLQVGEDFQIDQSTQQHILQVGKTPIIIRNCLPGVTKMRMMVRYEKGKVPSQSGRHTDALLMENTFSQGINVTYKINLPARDWRIDPDSKSISLAVGEKKRLPFNLHLPDNVSMGIHDTLIDLKIQADTLPYTLSLQLPYQVGLGDIEIEVVDVRTSDNGLIIKQIIRNNSVEDELLNFNCNLYIPGQRRKQTRVVKLGVGSSDTKTYHLKNADRWRGYSFRIRAEQDGGRRVLNKDWTIGENWDENDSSARFPFPRSQQADREQEDQLPR
ncbi:hypothetical protein Pla110_46240 [Polystyrenella longa]|uniref:Uncharacterized protein n=1 Tax=Polystyrenella longa TaxID=2528007 RepID=A0A518CUF7_9PLAN|nr:hypothetical protein [Polystyrenella longa]QDU82861.1 hypothetical protein Pla110_46240 [Polystyrenella longa]